jgi:hypothetical protein
MVGKHKTNIIKVINILSASLSPQRGNEMKMTREVWPCGSLLYLLEAIYSRLTDKKVKLNV